MMDIFYTNVPNMYNLRRGVFWYYHGHAIRITVVCSACFHDRRDGEISGKPRKSANLALAGWTVSVSSDRKTLKLIPIGGTTIFVR